MRLDQTPLSALPQRVDRDHSGGSPDGFPGAAIACEQPNRSLQGVQHPLPEPFAIEHGPLVVPGGEELAGLHDRRGTARVGQLPVADLEIVFLRTSRDQPAGPGGDQVNVDVDGRPLWNKHKDGGFPTPERILDLLAAR